MKCSRRLAVAAFAVTMLVATPVAGAATTQHHSHCGRTYTVRETRQAVHVAYNGTRSVSTAERRHLAWMERCTRHARNRPRLLAFNQSARQAWIQRQNPWNGPAIASWYDDDGSTACGFHATYGFASLILPCGAQITMRGPGGTVVATMQDHGPYISGRTFDLSPALKAALGCSDLCQVYWQRN